MLSKAARPFIEFYHLASFGSPRHLRDNSQQFWQGISLGWHAAIRYKRLSNMSDDALARQGLTRASIGRYAFFGRDSIGHGQSK